MKKLKVINYQTRATNGTYAPSTFKRFMRKLTRFILLVLIICFVVYAIREVRHENTPIQTDSAIDQIMKEDSFKQETLLRAETLQTTREKDDEEKRHQQAVATENALYVANTSRIEGELERIRQAELELGTTQSSFN